MPKKANFGFGIAFVPKKSVVAEGGIEKTSGLERSGSLKSPKTTRKI